MGKAVITEVTRMHHAYICVGAFHLELKKIIRPLPFEDQNWNIKDYKNNIFRVGNLINCAENVREKLLESGNPHSHEDWKQVKPSKIGSFTEKKLFDLLKNYCDSTIEMIFGTKIINNQYLNTGTGKKSLGSIIIDSKNFKFDLQDNPYKDHKQLRGQIIDHDKKIYDLPVTSLDLLNQCEDKRNDIEYMNKKFINSKNELIVRIGLTHSFTGKGKFSPRNYIQINGLIGI